MTPGGDGFDPYEFERDERGRPIPTHQVPEEGPGALATIGQRIAARLFDTFVVVFLPANILVALFGDTDGGDVSVPVWVLVVQVLIAAAYEITLVATGGATLGKRLMGIEVVRHLDGGRPTWAMSAIRFLVPSMQYTGLLVFQAVALVIYLTAVWHPERRGLHDRAGGTLVVRTR